jgi:hypothetical protein
MPENRRGRLIRGNPVAQNPLLRKGGVHQKSRSAERRGDRKVVEDGVGEWWEDMEGVEGSSFNNA